MTIRSVERPQVWLEGAPQNREVIDVSMCKSPLVALFIGEYKPNGKKKLHFLRKHQYSLDVKQNLHVYYNHKEKVYPPYMKDGSPVGYLLIPCGQCTLCKVARSQDWATRMCCELHYHDRACFITLTYDDAHLPFLQYVDENGEMQLSNSPTVLVDDCQDFMKRLRKKFEPQRIRFYNGAEYGEKTHRPHYHMILFGIDFHEDREPLRTSKDGFIYYRSPTLERLWDKGFSLIADVNWSTCAYVARYTTKKLNSRNKEYVPLMHINPEFSTMSRKPGIGRQYYEDHKAEIFANQELFVQGFKGGKKVKPPKYFYNLLKKDDPILADRICVENVKMSDNISSQKLKETDVDLLKVMEIAGETADEQQKMFRRDFL